MEISKQEILDLINDAFEHKRYATAHRLALGLTKGTMLLSCEELLLVSIAIHADASHNRDFQLAHKLWRQGVTRLTRKRMQHLVAPYGIRLAEAYLNRRDTRRAWDAFQEIRPFVTTPADRLHYNVALVRYERQVKNPKMADGLRLT